MSVILMRNKYIVKSISSSKSTMMRWELFILFGSLLILDLMVS